MSVVTLFSPELQIIALGTVSTVSSPSVNKLQGGSKKKKQIAGTY